MRLSKFFAATLGAVAVLPAWGDTDGMRWNPYFRPRVERAASASDNESAALRQVNLRRNQIGLPSLSAESHLTTAARAHSTYLAANNTTGHNESSSRSGYTGADPGQRITAAGYGWATYSEVISFGPATGPLGIESLIEAIYHRFGVFNTKVAEGGIGVVTSHPAYGTVLTANFGATTGNIAAQSADWIGVYPYDGQSGVSIDFYSDEESPDPVAGANRVGYPVSLHIDGNKTLSVSSFTLTSGSGESLSGTMLSPGADAYTPSSVVAFIPTSVLSQGTTYTAAVIGSAGGTAFSKTWSFSTAALSNIALSPSAICVVRGSTTNAYVTGGTESYSRVGWSNSAVVDVAFTSSNQLSITGKASGTAQITITDSASSTGTATVTVADQCSSSLSSADRVFNWAEALVPHLLEPKGPATQTVSGIVYRYYPITNVYVGVIDNVLYYYDPQSMTSASAVGPLSTFLGMAQDAGY